MLDLQNIFNNFFHKIPNPPYEYEFLISLPESEYPRYLKKYFKQHTGKNLNLKNPKTFNEKIQWLKLYDSTQLKTQLTDKVLVRNWIKEKIGENYLKPVLQICKTFDEINFEKLPDSFIIKTNHGCKWHYIIKNKKQFLNNPIIYNLVKEKFDNWLNQTFFPFARFELQYKDISPQIIIEPLLIDKKVLYPTEYEIYCLNGEPKLFQKVTYSIPAQCSVFNENFEFSEIILNPDYNKTNESYSHLLKEAVILSKKLSDNFKLVRVDWLEYKGKIYFNEMTFTPYSGVFLFENEQWNYKLGNMLKLK